MREWLLLEELKVEAGKYINSEGGANNKLYELAEGLYDDLKKYEGFSSDDSISVIFGSFATTSESDGNYSYAEYESFKTLMGKSGSAWSYDAFRKEMDKYSSYEAGNRTIELSRKIKSAEIARRYVLLNVATAMSDGPFNGDEEMWCASLCRGYCERFGS